MNGRPVTVIIVGAGTGSRFGGTVPKQYCLYGGRPLLFTTIECVRRSLPGARICLVLAAVWIDRWYEMCRDGDFSSPPVIAGGATRWQSVKNAVDMLEIRDGEIIMVHDAARPLLKTDVAARLYGAIEAGASGAIPVLPMTDSIRELTDDGKSAAVDRSRFVRVQTPQAFDGAKLRDAYTLPYNPMMTDDASVMEMAGHGVPVLVEGDECLLKVTRRADMNLLAVYGKENS